MTAIIKSMGSRLQRIIVMRQIDGIRWSVVGYERQGGRWRFTWLLCPATSRSHARQRADDIAREMGLPVAELALAERIRLLRSNGQGAA